jgi:hypothetical protein
MKHDDDDGDYDNYDELLKSPINISTASNMTQHNRLASSGTSSL